MKRLFFLLLLVAASRGWSQIPKKSTVPVTLFSVGGEPVYTTEFVYLYKKNHNKNEDFTEQNVNKYIDLLVNFKLKVHEAKSRGVDTTETFRKEFNTYKADLKKPFAAEKDEVEQLSQQAYQRMQEEVRASHILIAFPAEPTPADTLDAWKKTLGIRERIIKGEDFQKLAREFSDDPTAKANGGDLGYFTVLQMVYPFEQAAFGLKAGELSQPVRTRFGYHIIKLTGRRPARGEVEVSHILLRTGTSDDNKVKTMIFEISDQLRGGRNWDDLCKEYSDDPATKNSGGRLKPFSVGALAGVPEFEETAFSLKSPGEISDPFKSAYGWHLIRLEKKIPVPPYKEVESALKRRISRDERLQVSNKKVLEERKKKYGFSENADIKNKVLASGDTSLLKGNWKYKGDPSIKSQTLFSFGPVALTAGQFIAYAEKNQRAHPSDRLIPLYDRCVLETLDAEEEKYLLANNAEYKTLWLEYREGILLFTVMEQEVWNKASGDSTGQKKFYEANKEKYKAGDRVNATVYSSTDAAFIDEVIKKSMAGDSIGAAEAKKFKAVYPERNYSRGDFKAVDKVPWAIGMHKAENDGTYYLVVINNLVPPGFKSFAEARAQVITDYQDNLERKWVTDLKQKYPVKINNKGRKIVINELIPKVNP